MALPNLVGSLLRLPYTFAVPKFGGRNWTVASAALLLIPTLGFAYAVQRPDTPYWMFCLIAATAGLGGGNFASSMANINFFYPAAKKGAALGLNAAGGNFGVALIQFFLPVIVGGAGMFGIVKASERVSTWSGRPGYAGLAIVATVAAYFFMDNLGTAQSAPREQLQVVRKRQTWIMAFLYIGTFGSFIGYSAAMPLLIKLNFWCRSRHRWHRHLLRLLRVPRCPRRLRDPALRGWLADRFGGAKVTLGAFGAMVGFTLCVLWTLMQLTPNPTADPAIASANQSWFPWFLAFFPCVFAATGIGNGSTYKMIPAIWRTEAERATTPGTGALRRAAGRNQAGLGGDRCHRRGRRHRRVPDPDGLQRRGSRTRCRPPRARSSCSPASTSARPSPGSSTSGARREPRHEPGGCGDLSTNTHCPYCSLQCGMTLQRTGVRSRSCPGRSSP